MRKIALLLAAIVVVLVAIYVLGVVRNEDHTKLDAPGTATIPTTPTVPTTPTTPTVPTVPTADPAPGSATSPTDATAAASVTAGATAATDSTDTDATVDAAIDSNLGDHTQYARVFSALQAGVGAHDAAAVAALVQYPFAATIAGKKKMIKDPAAFVQDYDAIVTPSIAKVVTAQKYADLFVNYKGVMFGNGEVWINGICRDDACKQFDARVVTIQSGP